MATHTIPSLLDTEYQIPKYRFSELPGLKNPSLKIPPAEIIVSPSLIDWHGVIQSCVVEGLKKESKIEYTNRAGKAFIDFPIGASTNYSSEFTGLIFSVFFARHIIEEPCTPEEVCEA